MCNVSRTGCPRSLSRMGFFLGTRLFWIFFAAGSLARFTPAQLNNVVEYRYDNSRSGLNSNETTLTPANVNSTQFGKLFSQPVDGQVFTQPLYVQNVAIPGKGNHNVVFLATENDSVYAFDADSNTGVNANPLWKVSVIDMAHGAASGATPVSNTLYNCKSINPIFGVTGTPTIDVLSGTMYLEAMSMENGSVVHRLHALNITTGAEKAPGPKLVAPSVPGSGDGSVSGTITFDPTTQYNKTALLLLNGTLYISYGAPCDTSPYHGWLLAYNISDFSPKAVYNTSPNGGKGGIWMSGGGLAADSSGNLYFTTGNGSYDGVTSFADSVIKVGPISNGTFPRLDWFTPFDQSVLDSHDLDQSAGGVLLLPDQPAGSPRQHLLVTGGKDGTIYLLDRDNLGQFNPNNNSQVWQSLPKAVPALFSTPTWWNNNVYVGGAGTTSGTSDNLRAYKFDPATSMLSGVSTSQSPEIFKFPAPNTTVSSNGTTNAIVWAVATGPYNTGGSGNLHAYDATNLAHELYNTSQNSGRDNPGLAVKFAIPTVINGKVYVAMMQLNVYGELNPGSAAPTITSANSTGFTVGAAGNFTVTATGNPAPTFSETGALPSGVTLSASGVLSGTPAAGTAGNYPIVITAKNGVLPNATQNFTLIVGQPPAITSANSTTFTAGTSGNFPVTATGTPAPTFSETGALPSGVTLNSGTGVLSGTPAAGTGGTYKITITAQNGVAPNATQAFTLTVDQAAAISSANTTTFSVGVAGAFTVTATGVPAPTISESGTLPSGVTFNPNTQVLSGTPAAGTAANYPITFTAHNGVGADGVQNFTLTVNTSGGGGFGLVQENAIEGSNVSSVSVAFPTANTSGNLIIVCVRMSSTSQTVTVTDSAGNPYVEAVAQVQTLGTSQVHLFYAKKILGAANTVKATFSSANVHPWLAIYEYQGLNTSNPLDQTASAQGNSAAPNSGATPTTTSANELVFGAMAVPATYPGTQTVGSGFTLLQQDISTSHASNESQLANSTGSYAATFVLSKGTYWAAIVATFKP